MRIGIVAGFFCKIYIRFCRICVTRIVHKIITARQKNSSGSLKQLSRVIGVMDWIGGGCWKVERMQDGKGTHTQVPTYVDNLLTLFTIGFIVIVVLLVEASEDVDSLLNLSESFTS